MNIKKTANLLLNFAFKRLAEIFGILVSLTGLLLFLALITYSPNDPNFIFPENTKIENLMGFQGSFVSDLFFQSVGLISYLIPFTLIFTGINILKTKDFFYLLKIVFLQFYICCLEHFFLNTIIQIHMPYI
jgi:S-DNA-T family DNA segregation ATPase FtsK/SpoIIIE